MAVQPLAHQVASTNGGECEFITPCREHQYESIAPTPTSDRVCLYRSKCCTNHFESGVINSPTSDRKVCLPITDCEALGLYKVIAPTATSDAECDSHPCIPVLIDMSHGGTVEPDPANSILCEPDGIHYNGSINAVYGESLDHEKVFGKAEYVSYLISICSNICCQPR